MRKRTLSAFCLLCTTAPAAVALDVTANAGYMSEYIFRGIPQDDSAAMGGLDLAHNGFYAGTWAADVGEGLEVDLYGGYGATLGSVSWTAGVTHYTYTDDFDDDYSEVNLGLGWRIFSLDAAFGRYGNFDGPSADYSWVSPAVEYRGFFARAGWFGRDFEGEHYELGYGGHFQPLGIDWELAGIYSSDELLGEDSGSTSLVLTLSRSFDLLRRENTR